MSKKKRGSFAGDTKIALVLAAVLAGAGQPPGQAPVGVQQSAIRAELAPTSGTRSQAPTGTQTSQQMAENLGDGKRRRRQRADPNRLRRARRWLERQGFPREGRAWRRFRGMARTQPAAARVLEVAIEKGNT